MHKHTANRHLTLLLSIVLIFAFGASSLFAQEAVKAAGKWSATQAKLDTTNVADVEGHYLSVMTSLATNMSTGETKFMDGASVVNTSFSDLTKGNGPQRGYVVLTEGGNVVACSYQGQVSTTPGKDGPVVSFEGTFTWTKGTGQYAGIKGKGTYRGHYTSKTTYDVEWMGEYSIKK